MLLKGVSVCFDLLLLCLCRYVSKVVLEFLLKMDASKFLRFVDDGDDVDALLDEELEWE